MIDRNTFWSTSCVYYSRENNFEGTISDDSLLWNYKFSYFRLNNISKFSFPLKFRAYLSINRKYILEMKEVFSLEFVFVKNWKPSKFIFRPKTPSKPNLLNYKKIYGSIFSAKEVNSGSGFWKIQEHKCFWAPYILY